MSAEGDLRFIAEASIELARCGDHEETLRRIAAIAVQHFADWCAVDMLDDAGELQRLAVAHIEPAKAALGMELFRRYPPPRDGAMGTWHVIRTGEPEILSEIPDELLVLGARDPEQLALARSLGFRSYMGLPVRGRDRVLGVVTFVSSDSQRVFGRRELDLATDLVSRASVAVQNAQLVAALRQSQARQSFLLSLTDVLRGPESHLAILDQVCEMLGRHFGVDRVGYGHVDETLDMIDYDVCWTDGTVAPLLGQFAASAFGRAVIDKLRAGDTVAIANVRDHALTSDVAALRTSHEVETRAILVVPLSKAGRLRTIVYLNQRPARAWTGEDVALMEEVAERTRELIERGRTEEALRASEARWRALAEALQDRERQLREADARKDEFLATLAHELRNPLAPLRNGLAILARVESDPATGVRARELMQRQLAHLVRLVDDLLDVSRVSQGKVALKRSAVPLQAVVELALETSRPLIDAAGHHLSVDLPAAPILLDADPTRLAQVISNLLNNAAKYTPAGGRIAVAAHTTATGRLQVVVDDDGVGIPPDMLDRVFDLFTQVGGALDRSQGGLGIGLSLARRLVELHGGSIHAQSEGELRGSRFVIELPLPPPVAG